MAKLKEFLDSKIVKKDVGEETYLTWRETISYALGRGAQGMFTSMTGSKYLNYFLTNVLFSRFSNPMGIASKIRLYCGDKPRSTADIRSHLTFLSTCLIDDNAHHRVIDSVEYSAVKSDFRGNSHRV